MGLDIVILAPVQTFSFPLLLKLHSDTQRFDHWFQLYILQHADLSLSLYLSVSLCDVVTLLLKINTVYSNHVRGSFLLHLYISLV